MSFLADYPGAIVVPAHSTNFYDSPNNPKGWVLHTPEEPADNTPSTPYYFAQPNKDASTHYFVSWAGKVYQCVPERFMAIANGVLGKPYPSWADPAHSLNRQTLSVEIEGEAAKIGQTLVVGGPQWTALVALLKHRAAFHGFPFDREHTIGHYQVASNRTDPGEKFPWAQLFEEDAMTPEEKARLENVERQVFTARRDLNELANGMDAVSVANKWPLSVKGLWFVARKAWPF